MKILCCLLILLIPAFSSWSQQDVYNSISLQVAIEILSIHSPSAEIEKLNYRNELLKFENFKKSYLPSISFDFNPINFNRSYKLLQKTEDGSYTYVEDYSNNSSFGATIRQKIGFTGGELTLSSNLYYLNEFSKKATSFNTTPISLGYSQSLWGGGKNNKYEQKIERRKNEAALKEFCMKMTDIQQQTLSLYMDAVLTQLEMDLLSKNHIAFESLLRIAKTKKEQGTFTEYDYKQVELQFANNLYATENMRKTFEESLHKLLIFLGVPFENNKNIHIEIPVFNLPQKMDADFIANQIYRNNPFVLNQEIKRLEAEKSFFSTKLSNQFNGRLNVSYGINQYAETLREAYAHPNSRQSITLGLEIPIFQWGANRNNIRMAKNTYQARIIDLKKSETEFASRVQTEINTYNKNVNLWILAKQAFQLAEEQYDMTMNKITLGKASVYELESVRREQTSTMRNYYNAIRDLWTSYYKIRSLALYDFVRHADLVEVLVETAMKENVDMVE